MIRLKNLNKKFIVLIVLLLIAQIILFNYDSNSGVELVELNDNVISIRNENNKHQQQIASFSSISTISIKASQLGLKENQELKSLTSPLPIAYKENLSF